MSHHGVFHRGGGPLLDSFHFFSAPFCSRSRDAQRNQLTPNAADNSDVGVPSGWYPDPQGIHSFRFWDGHQWTNRVEAGGVEQVAEI